MLTKIKALNDANKISQHWENSREASAATEECILTVFIGISMDHCVRRTLLQKLTEGRREPTGFINGMHGLKSTQ